jgi:hypothetical protein
VTLAVRISINVIKGLEMKSFDYFEKRRHKTISQDRSFLTDYEKEQLIPELKSRLNVLVQYFKEIIHLCDIQKGSQEFNVSINSIINPQGLQISTQDSVQTIAEKFYESVKAQAQKEGVDDIESLLKSYENIDDAIKLGLFINEINLQCSSLMVVKNHLFLFKIEGYPFITNKNTGETIACQPKQYFLTTEPFQIVIHNIMGVAKALSDTVHEWHKYNMNLKSKYLDIYISSLSLRNTKLVLFIQMLTIVLAVSLSAFFLVARDPFNLIKENNTLKYEVGSLKQENTFLKSKFEKGLTLIRPPDVNR